MNLILIKYGGSVITDKKMPRFPCERLISSLNSQVVELQNETGYRCIIGNGGGSFGHYYAQKYQLYDGQFFNDTYLGICRGKSGNSYLNRLIVEDFLKRNVPACSVRISASYLNTASNKNDWNEIYACLENNIIPVLYGDILFYPDKSYNIISTEQAFIDLSNYLVNDCGNKYHIVKFIFCTNTDGVIDKFGMKIERITKDTFDNTIFWTENNAYDVTGGMKEKVAKSLLLSKVAPVQIVNGLERDCISRSVKYESSGTLVISC